MYSMSTQLKEEWRELGFTFNSQELSSATTKALIWNATGFAGVRLGKEMPTWVGFPGT